MPGTGALPRRLKQALALGLLVMGLGSCGDSSSIESRRGPAGAQTSTLPAPPPFADTPDYAHGLVKAASGLQEAQFLYSKLRVDVIRFDGLGSVAAIESSTVSMPVQGLALSVDAAGAPFAVLAEVDFRSDTSSIKIWTDSNANLVPDAAGASTIVQIPASHVIQLSLDVTSGTLYALDRLGDRVLRLTDTDNDRIPDASSMTTFVAVGGVLGTEPRFGALRAPAPTSVEVVQRDKYLSGMLTLDSEPDIRQCTDTNADGVADAVSP